MNKYSTYDPLEDRVLIRPLVKESKLEKIEDKITGNIIYQPEMEKTESGIIIPHTIHKEISEGVVIASGQGYTARDSGVFVGNVLHKGDTVLYGTNTGVPIDVQNEQGGYDECRLMREGDVLCLIKKSDQNS